MSDEESGDSDYSDYESGPFCRHWCSPPSDCDELCARCGHSCSAHHDDGCGHEGCECQAWDSGDDSTKAENPQPKPGV